MGFVGNYAPCGLSPQTDGMPVIPKKHALHDRKACFLLLYYPKYFSATFRNPGREFMMVS